MLLVKVYQLIVIPLLQVWQGSSEESQTSYPCLYSEPSAYLSWKENKNEVIS